MSSCAARPSPPMASAPPCPPAHSVFPCRWWLLRRHVLLCRCVFPRCLVSCVLCCVEGFHQLLYVVFWIARTNLENLRSLQAVIGRCTTHIESHQPFFFRRSKHRPTRWPLPTIWFCCFGSKLNEALILNLSRT
ncbi:hypothetical protein BS78_05G117200 [Paspalum vaginatum]|nr:hypothetical protein BS78_05G117200 [Paspalum vaginatum]